jgi:hypothetical protein
MQSTNFTTSFVVDKSPDAVFEAVNNVRGWWSGNIDGSTDTLDGEFTYRYKHLHMSRQKITELVPGEKVVWRVLDAYLDFVEDKSEWIGTEIRFDITAQGDKTELRFTHRGLAPEIECYDMCSSAWGSYINGSLRKLISSGDGNPNPKEAN